MKAQDYKLAHIEYLWFERQLGDHMNEITQAKSASEFAWPNGDHRMKTPNNSMLPGSEQATTAAVDALDEVAQGAHDTIDRLADSAAPTVRRLGESVTAAGEMLRAKTDQLRITSDELAASARSTIRDNPLVCIAAAVTLGAVISRLVRPARGDR